MFHSGLAATRVHWTWNILYNFVRKNPYSVCAFTVSSNEGDPAVRWYQSSPAFFKSGGTQIIPRNEGVLKQCNTITYAEPNADLSITIWWERLVFPISSLIIVPHFQLLPGRILKIFNCETNTNSVVTNSVHLWTEFALGAWLACFCIRAHQHNIWI